jgi:Mg2+ and Co2+ transporter CorA
MLTLLASSSKEIASHMEHRSLLEHSHNVYERYKRQQRQKLIKRLKAASNEMQELLNTMEDEEDEREETDNGERYFSALDDVVSKLVDASSAANNNEFFSSSEKRDLKELEHRCMQIYEMLEHEFDMFGEDVSFGLSILQKKLNVALRKLAQQD